MDRPADMSLELFPPTDQTSFQIQILNSKTNEPSGAYVSARMLREIAPVVGKKSVVRHPSALQDCYQPLELDKQ